MSLSLDFSGQTVVVVGGTSGINRGIAEHFGRHGARVAVASRNQEKVDNTVAALEASGAEAMGFAADVRHPEAIVAGFSDIHSQFGDFDVLISGAAGNFPATAKGMSTNAFKTVVEIDLLGTFHVMKAAYDFLKKPGASIINVSAPQSYLPMEAQAHVCSAKAGVDMITRTLALEWGPEGIRVNSIVPGPIEETEGMDRLAPTPELQDVTRVSVPLRRLGTKEDMAHICLFLGSPLASYINGVVLPVDGGWSQSGCGGMSQFLGDFARSRE